MAIGAHADDIEIMVGGTLLKYHALGYEIVYVMSTNNMSGNISELQSDGSTTTRRPGPLEVMRIRKAECDAAAAMLGTRPIHLDHPQRHYYDPEAGRQIELRYGCKLPEGCDPDVPSILTASEDVKSVDRLSKLILETDPEVIFTNGINQRNIEHFATALLVTLSFWRAVDHGYQGALLQWREEHTLHGEANIRWDTFIDNTCFLDQKMRLISQHKCQMPTAEHPDHGHRLLSIWKGRVNGCEAAETFTWVRRPIRRDSEIFGFNAPIYGEIGGELLLNSR